MSSSVQEIRQAIPSRGQGAPARTNSHRERILALLRERGAAGVNGSELYSSPHLYGRSPRNRISELRKDGHLIEGKPRSSNDWHYRLIRDNEGTSYGPSPDWYEQKTGQQRPQSPPPSYGPLFSTCTDGL